MAEIKLTKNGLRDQQVRLAQLARYLPTLQLKKAMLQAEVQVVRQAIQQLEKEQQQEEQQLAACQFLLALPGPVQPREAAQIREVRRRYENIAGVEIPYFEGVVFAEFSYSLFETAPWVDGTIIQLRALAERRERIAIAYEQRRALEKEWRDVSIRVNLFEKILIPRAMENIRRIKVFLGDQQMDAVARAKVAKKKKGEPRGGQDA